MSAYEYIWLLPGGAIPSTIKGVPFKCIVLINHEVPRDWQISVSRWLVTSGCLYMIAWGQNSSSWDDSVDIANLERFDFAEVPDDDFVMTTWHACESLEEIFRFASISACHPTVDVKRLVVVDIGQSEQREALQVIFSRQSQ